jgi:hypothetical protein
MLVDQSSTLKVKSWSVNSPTIQDSEMDVQFILGGKTKILFDPPFFNELGKFFRNNHDQSAQNVQQILDELIKQEAEKNQIEELVKNEK